MHDELIALLSARKGHFELESGRHCDVWLDLDSLFVRAREVAHFADELAARLAAHPIEAVCGPLLGGAFLAQRIAAQLDVDCYFAERGARAPEGVLDPYSFTLPTALRASVRGKSVAIVDDVISAGSAVRATLADLEACGARPVALGALAVLSSSAREFAKHKGLSLEYLASLPNSIWAPEECPLCASGVPLENLGR